MKKLCLLFALVACGSIKATNPDAGVDGPRADAAIDSLDAPPGTKVTLTTYGATGPVNTQLVAIQDGDGAWTVLSGSAGVYTAMVHGDRFGLMSACSGTTGGGVLALYAAVSDGTSWYTPACGQPAPPMPAAATISGSVTGAAAADAVRVLNDFDEVDLPAGTTSYSLGTHVGPSKLFAEELDSNSRPTRLAVVDATVTDGATIDFDLGAGFAPVTHTITASAPIARSSLVYRDPEEYASLDQGTTDFRALPANQLGSGLDHLTVSAVGTATSSQYVVRYFANPYDQTITFLPSLQLAPQPTVTASPYPTVSAMLPVQAGATVYDFDFSTDHRGWSTTMTGAYVAKAFPGNTVTYTMPDYRGLAGWQAGSELESGQPISFTMDEQANANVEFISLSFLPPNQYPFHDGSEERISSISGQLTAP